MSFQMTIYANMLNLSMCTIRIRHVIIWLAHIMLMIVVIAQAGVIQNREISSFSKEGLEQTNSTQRELYSYNSEDDEPKFIALITTELPFNESLKNDTTKLSLSLPKDDFLHMNKTSKEATTPALLKDLQEENKQSNEALNIFNNDALQIFDNLDGTDVTTKRPFMLDVGVADLQRDFKQENNSQIPLSRLLEKPTNTAIDVATQSNIAHNTTLNILIVNSPQTTNLIPISTTRIPNQNEEPLENVTENIDSVDLKNSTSPNLRTTTISNKGTDISQEFDLKKINPLTTLSTTTTATTFQLENLYTTGTKVKVNQNNENGRSLDLIRDKTFHNLKNINDNEIITSTSVTKDVLFLESTTEYSAISGKRVSEDMEVESNEVHVVNEEKRIKKFNNNSISAQHRDLPSAAGAWPLVDIKAAPKLNSSMETAHKHLLKIDNNDYQSIPVFYTHNNEKNILDWSQIMATNELINKEIEYTTTEDSSKNPPFLLSSTSSTSIILNTNVNTNEVTPSKISTTETNNLRLTNIVNSTQSDHVSLLSEANTIKGDLTKTNSTETNKDESANTPADLSVNTTNKSIKTKTETETEFKSLQQAEIEIGTIKTPVTLAEFETAIHPPTTSGEKLTTLTTKSKADQENNDEMQLKNDANNTMIIIDDAAATTTLSTSVDIPTLVPVVGETTSFSTLVTGEYNASVSALLPDTAKHASNNQGSDTIIKYKSIINPTTNLTKTNILNSATPTNLSTHHVSDGHKKKMETDLFSSKNSLGETGKEQMNTTNESSIEITTTTTTTTTASGISSITLETHLISQETVTTIAPVRSIHSEKTFVQPITATSTITDTTTTTEATIFTYEDYNKNEESKENTTIAKPSIDEAVVGSAAPSLGLNIEPNIEPKTRITSTETTSVASSNIGLPKDTSLEANVVDELNKNKSDITKPIAQDSIIMSRKPEVTADLGKGDKNKLTTIKATTKIMSTLFERNTTTREMLTSLHNDESTKTAATEITTMTTPTSLISKIDDFHNVIVSITDRSMEEPTTLHATLSTNEKTIDETPTTSTVSAILDVSSITMVPSATVILNRSNIIRTENTTITPILTTTMMESDELHLFRPKASETSGETDVNVIIAITVSVIGVVALILLVAFLYLMRKRQKSSSYSQRCRPVSLDDYTIDSTSIYNSMRSKGSALRASKRSHANLAFDDPSLRHNVLGVVELSKFLQEKSSIYEEFRDVPQVRARIDEVPLGCEDKNRYANVVPLPETRVMLHRLNNDVKTEFINANFVRGPKDAAKYYIACQAPLDSTIEDFWRMIWEQNSRVIIQATDLVENGVEKCAEYLPPSVTLDNHTTFGEFQVTLHHREVKDKYATSIILLKHTGENVTRELTHYWFKWPEVGVPLEEAPIIAMLLEARSSLITYAIEYSNEIKEGLSSTVTLKSAEEYLSANSRSLETKRSPGDSNTKEINGNISMVQIRKKTDKHQGPLTIHCSPGTGRTGTIIACDIAIRSLEMPNRTVDIPQIVYYVRHGRASAVLTKEQYEFIYRVANMYATKITNPSNEH